MDEENNPPKVVQLWDIATQSPINVAVTEQHEEPDEEEKYTPWRLKMKIWDKAYKWVQNKTIQSNNHIKMFNGMLEDLDRSNLVNINQTKMAKEYGVSRQTVYNFLRSLEKIGFIHKRATGLYMVNPYVYASNRAWNKSGGGNQNVVALQKWWWFNVAHPIALDELGTTDSLNTNKEEGE